MCYIYFQNNLNGGTQKLLTEISGANQGIHKNFSSNTRNLSFREVYTTARSLETRLCRICLLKYVGKSETSFHIRLNNHRKDSKNTNPILACKYYQNLNHNSQRDGKFTLIEQITKTFTTLQERVTATSKETGKLLDSKNENTLSRWFESRT